MALFGALLLTGCGFSQTSSTPVVAQRVPVKTIAMMPGGGILAEAVAVELSARGFTIIDPAATSSLIVRLRLKEVEITQVAGLSRFKSQGIDAVLVVRAVGTIDSRKVRAPA